MPTNILLLLILCIFILVLIFSVAVSYLYSLTHTKTWFYGYMVAIIIFVQVLSDLGSSLTVVGYHLHLASVLFFPAVIFGLFVTYTLYSISHAKQLLNLLVAGNVVYITFFVALSLFDFHFVKYVQSQVWWQNHLFSSLALILDFVLLTMIWPVLHNLRYFLPQWLKIFLAFGSILLFDAIIFNFGAYWGSPSFWPIISGAVVSRLGLACVITPLISLYLSFHRKTTGDDLEYHEWDDFFVVHAASLQIKKAQSKIASLEKVEGELLKSQKLLHSQNQELRKFLAAVEQSSEMMVITDPDGIVLWGNPSVESMTGFTLKEALGRKAGALWGNLMSKIWYEALWQTIKVRKERFSGEINNHKKSGEQFLSSISIYPLLDSYGQVEFFVASQRDITKEKEIDRMKTDFISLASHQLRTPLSAIKWFLEMLVAGDFGKLNDKQQDAVKNISLSNERLIEMVNALLNISRVESGRVIVEPKLLNPVKLVEEVVAELAPKLESKNQSLVISAPKHIPQLSTDAKLLRQVIYNLIINAHKYSPDKSPIKIDVSLEPTNLLISIIDRGYGIPESEQSKIFDRFYRASNIVKQETDGTGLGLYLSRSIATTLGGSVEFVSREHKGSTFTIKLPLSGTVARSGQVGLE